MKAVVLLALLLILVCIVLEIAGRPFRVKTARHSVLQKLELTSLLVEWMTLWCGLMIYQSGPRSKVMNVVMTLFVVVCNVLLMLWFVFVLVGAYVKHKCLGIKGKGRDDSNGKTGANDEMELNANPLGGSSDTRRVELVQHHDGPDDENATDGHSLPVGWQVFETEDGAVYYCRPDGKTTWEAPW